MRKCICQICVCGRHRCEHTGKHQLVPFAKDTDCYHQTTEHKERYKSFGFQPRQQPVKPPSCTQWKGDEPLVKISTTKKDFVAFPIKKRSLKRPKLYKEAKGEMACSTTYKHDYVPMKGSPVDKVKIPQPCRDGTMPGTLPGIIDASTTYNKSYTPKPFQKIDKIVAKESTLTELGKPFTGQTETALCYQPHPYRKREQVLPYKGNLKLEGDFQDVTTHKAEFTPKYQIPERPINKYSKWKPSEGKFESDTTHKLDYKYMGPAEKAIACVPKPEIPTSKDRFLGKSHYKQQYQPHEVQKRKLPKWHPSFRPYKAPTTLFEGETTYRTDYEAPPEDISQYERIKPMKSNLTIPSEPMETTTTFMRDYRKIECPVPTRSFKPDLKFDKPKGKFVGHTITRMDYTPKKGEKMQKIKIPDNLKIGIGPMDDLSMTMKDFQWLAIECPAMYIKLFGKDALPQYQFDKIEGGHTFFKKRKKPESQKEASKRKKSITCKK